MEAPNAAIKYIKMPTKDAQIDISSLFLFIKSRNIIPGHGDKTTPVSKYLYKP